MCDTTHNLKSVVYKTKLILNLQEYRDEGICAEIDGYIYMV